MARSHIIPKFYLRGFTNSRGLIHIHRQGMAPIITSITNTAVRGGYFSDEFEQELSNKIETPGAHALHKVLAREPLNDLDKESFADLIVNLLKRVPFSRVQAEETLPKTREKFYRKINQEVDEVIAEDPNLESKAEKFRDDAIKALDNISFDDVWEPTTTRDLVDSVFNLILKMEWTILTTHGTNCFVTSDNPVFIPSREGLAPFGSQLSFPLSKHMALLATHHRRTRKTYKGASPANIREINRRTIIRALSDVYSPDNYDWISKVKQRNANPFKAINI